jgi:hypothetical protein
LVQFVHLNVSVGCFKSRAVEAGHLRLRRRQGLLLPAVPFVTESLPPDGWDPFNERLVRQMAARPASAAADDDTVRPKAWRRARARWRALTGRGARGRRCRRRGR